MAVEFEDYSLKVEGILEEFCESFLYEAGSLVLKNVKSGTKVASGQLKTSWQCEVDTGAKKVQIGSPLNNAIWNEFGTGEYAANGDGRHGWWVYVPGSSGSSGGKTYSYDKARQVVAMMRSEGIDAHMTKGKRPRRTLLKAFNVTQSAIIARAEQLLKSKLS